MQRKLKIMYISSEVSPFMKTGGLADVAGAFPKAIKDLNHDIRIFMPKYSHINERKYTLREVIRLKEIEVNLGPKKIVANIKSAFLPDSKVQVYFVENKGYFNSAEFYLPPATEAQRVNQAEQFIFFSRSVFEILKILHWQPDIIHCNDWQTALIPVYLEEIYKTDPFFSRTYSLLTIHDWAHQGIFDRELLPLLEISEECFNPDGDSESEGKINFLKAGIIYADIVNTTSKSCASEVQSSDEFAFGLQRVVQKKANNFYGIVNGIDEKVWNPESDSHISHKFSIKDMSGKIVNKRLLVESQGLKFDDKIPLIGTISRLTDLKGFDLITAILDDMLKLDVQYILLGHGDEKYHRFFKSAARKYPSKLAVNFKFDDPLAHQIEAGCDMYLMPSHIEACGLNQLYSLKYGTIPIVHATGGLTDTVKDFNPSTNRGYGFVFQKYSPESLLKILKRSIKTFHDQETWPRLVDRAMRLNFSWHVSAEKYINLYYQLVP